MPYISRRTKKRIGLFAAAFLFTYLMDRFLLMPNLTLIGSILYGFLILAWMRTIQYRIIDKRIYRNLQGIAGLLFLLFLLRMSRWNFFVRSEELKRWLWYMYYFPMTMVPCLTMETAVQTGREENSSLPWICRIPRTISILFIFAFLTNDLHQMAFPLAVIGGETVGVGHGPVYYSWLAWIILISIAGFVLLLNRCRPSSIRKYWWIPMIPVLVSTGFLLWYMVCNGSPRAGRFSLYNLQEVFALLYILMWECCIQIGLIPSNSSYGDIFRLSTIGAQLVSPDQTIRSAGRKDSVQKDERLNHLAVTGGEIIWREDLGPLRRLIRDLEETNQRLTRQNTLLEEQNQIQEEQIRLTTQQRLFRRIQRTTSRQTEQIARILEVPDPDIYQAAVFGAYIKRRANLALLAEREPVMDITELTLSVQEVLDYVMIRPECAGSVYQASGGYESSDILCGVFELFGSLVEASLSYIPSILVQIEAVYGFQMKVIIDAPTMTIPEDPAEAIWLAHGMETIVSREEDAVIVTLKERRAAS